MKLTVCVVGLVACAATPTPETSTPAADCPETVCEQQAPCPAQGCVTPPEPTRVAPAPIAPDWHCMDLRQPGGYLSGYCYPSAIACEKAKQQTGHPGKFTACTTQRIAHCVQIAVASVMTRQRLCARTAENCERRRKHLLENPPPDIDQASACVPTLNTDPYQSVEPPATP